MQPEKMIGRDVTGFVPRGRPVAPDLPEGIVLAGAQQIAQQSDRFDARQCADAHALEISAARICGVGRRLRVVRNRSANGRRAQAVFPRRAE